MAIEVYYRWSQQRKERAQKNLNMLNGNAIRYSLSSDSPFEPNI